MRAFVLICLAFFAAPAAMAQEWQSYSDDRGHGAFICPTGQHPSGQRLCVELYCKAKGAPAEWHVVLSGYDLPHGPQPLIVQVDGTHRAALLMRNERTGQDISLSLPFEEDTHAPLVRALARGANAMLFIGAGEGQLGVPTSLKGSSRALRAALPLCAAEGHAPMAVPDPAQGGDYVLTPDDVKYQLIGRDLTWSNPSGRAVTVFLPNGSYEGTMEVDGTARANNGTWWQIDNGDVCWKGGPASGCFQFRQEGGVINAYRVDGGANLLLGEVQIGG